MAIEIKELHIRVHAEGGSVNPTTNPAEAGKAKSSVDACASEGAWRGTNAEALQHSIAAHISRRIAQLKER